MVIKKRSQIGFGLLIISIFTLIFLANFTFPFNHIFGYLRENSNLFKEALRFPFTKFSIILMFAFSVFYAFGQQVLFNFFSKFLRKNLSIFLNLTLASLSLVIFMLPFFKGELISKYMQVKIPQEYFQMFDWFKDKSGEGRIANLPLHSLWGWTYYDFGFQGAQFISFGLKQPLLDRDFDRWNPDNEEYFKQLSYAIYSQDINLLEKVLEKYQINYIILDKNVLAPGFAQDKRLLLFDETESLLAKSKKIILEKNFGEISVYSFKSAGLFKIPKHFVNLYMEDEQFQDVDWAYIDWGDYLYKKSPDTKLLYYPFNFLADNQNFLNSGKLTIQNSFLELKTIPRNINLTLNDYLKFENYLPASIFLHKNMDNLTFKLGLDIIEQLKAEHSYLIDQVITDPNISYINIDENQTLEVKNNSNYQKKIFLSTNLFNNLAFYQDSKGIPINVDQVKDNAILCSPTEKNQLTGQKLINSSSLLLISKNGQTCLRLPVNKIVNKALLNGFRGLLVLEFEVFGKKGGRYCIFNRRLGRCVKEQNDIPSDTKVKDSII